MATGMMSGKRGLIMGVANDHSIAWGIAKRLAEHGAELAFTYQTPALGKRVLPLAKSLGSDFVLPCDVGLPPDADDPTVARFDLCARSPSAGRRSISWSMPSPSPTRTSCAAATPTPAATNFVNTMLVSCFSFTEVAQRAAAHDEATAARW